MNKLEHTFTTCSRDMFNGYYSHSSSLSDIKLYLFIWGMICNKIFEKACISEREHLIKLKKKYMLEVQSRNTKAK